MAKTKGEDKGINYIKSNLIPITVELLFIASCILTKESQKLYTNFLFYFLLAVYFFMRKDVSFKEWREALKGGKTFLKQVLLTILLMCLAFAATGFLETLFPHFNKGMFLLKVKNFPELLLFLCSTILLPPVVEETFYRKNMISFKSGKTIFITTVFGMFFYALEHALAPWGIFLCMIWALPLSISYMKTKNVYVPMTAHLVCNLVINGMTVIQVCKYLIG